MAAVGEFYGADSEIFQQRNRESGIVDLIRRAVADGWYDVGYHGAHEPTYDTTAQAVRGMVGKSWQEVYTATRAFCTACRDLKTGQPDASRPGSVARMQEVFGPCTVLSGVADVTSPPGMLALDDLTGCRVHFGFTDHGPALFNQDYIPAVLEIRRAISPAPETSPDVFWFMGCLITSSHPATQEVGVIGSELPPQVVAAKFQRLDRTRVAVPHMIYGTKFIYARASPTEYAYGGAQRTPPPVRAIRQSRGDDFRLPPELIFSEAERKQKVENFRQNLEWLLTRYFPANPGSRLVGNRLLVDLVLPYAGDSVTLPELDRAVEALLQDWTDRPPNYVSTGNRYLSLAQTFKLLATALKPHAERGSPPATMQTDMTYGPVGIWSEVVQAAEQDIDARAVTAAAAQIAFGSDRAPGSSDPPANRVPLNVTAGGKTMHAAQFLRLMAEAYRALRAGNMPAALRVRPSDVLPPLALPWQRVHRFYADTPAAYGFLQLWTVKPVQFKEAMRKESPGRAESRGPDPSPDSGPRPPRPPPAGGPWERDLLVAASEDGTTFAAAETFVEGGGVPSVIKDAKGRLVAAFQWFPAKDSPHFDRVAVKISEDGGKTWSAPQPIVVEGLPETYQRPFDPTLALAADGRIRLYFSCSPAGRLTLDENVATYSAISTDGVRYQFEPGVRFSVPGRAVIDCAALRLGEKWHYTAPRGRPDEGAYHAVSDDGLKFMRLDDIPSAEGVTWLGNLMPYGDGMRFYGNSHRGMWWAFSKDGATWTRPTYLGIGGGDPAAVQISDKRFLIIYTGEPQRRGLPPGAGPRPPGTGALPGEFPPNPRAVPLPRGNSPPREGPYTHGVCSASSQDGLTWRRDPGTRIDHASVPCAVADGDKRILLYYVDADRGPGRPESIGCAVSEDGLNFTKQPFAIEGLPSQKALDPCVLKDETGMYRLYYFASSMPGDPAGDPQAHKIRLAVSQDGIRFKEEGLAFERPGLVDPDVFQFKGQWFMYVFGGGATVIATSTDGRRFMYRQDLDLLGWGTTAPVLLEDGRLRLYAFEQRKRVGNTVRSFISTDGFQWAAEDGARLMAGEEEQITDPFVVRWKGGYKMFFKTQKPPRPPQPGPGRPAP